jgi:hypothetical protein
MLSKLATQIHLNFTIQKRPLSCDVAYKNLVSPIKRKIHLFSVRNEFLTKDFFTFFCSQNK